MISYDARIEKAVYILWVDMEFDRGQEAKQLLEEALASGMADAYYFLGRTYAGNGFINSQFGFEENEEKATEYFNLSIENGSALGMFAARRLAGFEPRCGSMIHAPYNSVTEVWDEVRALADSGEIFAQYLVANAYYYGDVIELMNVDMSQFTDEQATAQIRAWTETAAAMYDELIAKGMVMGAYNYIDIITSGDFGIPVNKKLAKKLEKIYDGKMNGSGIKGFIHKIFG